MATTRPLSELLPKEMAELRARPLFSLLLEVQPPIVVGKTPPSTGASASSAAAVSRANACAARCFPAAATGRPCGAATAPG